MSYSNYPEGVSGNEPEIIGWDEDEYEEDPDWMHDLIGEER